MKITNYGKAILKAMKESGGAVPITKGGWRVGAKKISEDLGASLIGYDLLKVKGTGELVLSEAGLAWLRRGHSDNEVDRLLPQSSPYQKQHQTHVLQTIEVNGRRGKVVVNLSESPLCWLAGRRNKHGKALISQGHVEAGEKLRQDYECGHYEGQLIARYEAVPTYDGRRAFIDMNPSERRVMAKARYDAAMQAMGPGLADVAFSVCCRQQGLTCTEQALGWPSRSAKVVLKIALDRLADHYGIEG